jgi:hypothetical protein
VKFDSVVKQCVLDQEVKDGKTLKNDFAQGFNPENPCETADCMVTKATWPSKVDVKKRVGSMMVWLEDKVDADHLLRTSTANSLHRSAEGKLTQAWLLDVAAGSTLGERHHRSLRLAILSSASGIAEVQ